MAPFLRSVFSILSLFVATAAFGATVTGTVTSAETRQPLRSMVVAAYDDTGTLRGTATTDAAGQYVLTLPAGNYRVLAYDPAGGYATAFDANAESFETSPLLSLGATGTVTVNFALVTGGTITGTVVDPAGNARPNATVSVYNLSGTRRAFTTTNPLGGYSVVLPPGDYKLVAFDDTGAFAATFYRNAANFGTATPVRVNAGATTSAIDFQLAVAARVVGSVVDGQTQAPLGSILVYAYSEDGVFVAATTTDKNGVFRFSLPAGRYRFVAGDPDRVYAPSFFANARSFPAAQVVTLTAGTLHSTMRLALQRGGVIAGVVTNEANQPLAGITVAAYNVDGTEHASTTTNVEGRYELVVAPGEFKLAVFDTQLTYATQFSQQRNAFAAADRIVVMTGQRVTYDFRLARGGRFNGVVRDAVTSQPLAGITVGAYDANGHLIAEATSDANGAYALVVPAGEYRLLAFDDQLRYATRFAGGAPSYEVTTPRRVDAGASANADFGLVRGTKVTGTVTDSSGRAISGVEIAALDASGNRVGGATAIGGTFAVVVPEGAYRFVVRDPLGRYLNASQNVTVGATTPQLTFVLSGASRRRAVGR